MAIRINLGSGQRRFDTTKGWINCDVQYRRPDQRPDVACRGEALPFVDSTAGMVVLHHVLEHFGCGEGQGLLQEAYRVLHNGACLLVFVPDLQALAKRWLEGGIDDYIYCVNLYGAYQGEETDRHKWGYSTASLVREIGQAAPWRQVKMFDWREIEGADIARDWWILACEAIK